MKSSPLHHRIHKHVVHHVHRVHKHVSHHTTHLLSSIRKAQLYRWYRAHLPAFTLTDTLVATGIFLILTSTVLVAINPLKMFVDSRNNKRIRELKVVRDSLVQYTTDNTAGATNILGVSIPPCTESPGTEIGTGEGKVDLSNLSGFIPTYLASVPIDPKIGTAASTGYRVCRKTNLDYCVTAMYPESAGSSTVTMDCDYSIITPSPTPPGTPTSTPTPTSAPVTSGLVLSHQMSAGTGTTSLDDTTNANNGTLTNGPTWTTGYIGSGISFDGTNDYVSVPSSTSLNMTNTVTVSAWVYPTNFADYRTMMIRINGGGTQYYGMSLNASGALICQFTAGSFTSSAMTLNAWNHVACTYDGATIIAYINGQSAGSTPATGNIGTPTSLGIGYDPINGRYFTGKMDDVRIYNRALSPTEIAQIKAPAPTPTATATPTPIPQIAATGGTITDVGGYRVHTFTTSGTFTVTQGGNVETLVVAGGGGGAAMTGGGGGAGGLIYDASHAVTAQAYSITVGAGGAGQVGTANPGNGSDGQNSVFSTLTAVGGGGAGTNSGTGRLGGSGGGAGHNNTTGGAGTAGQGYAGSGGNTTSPNYGAGGGGGAGAVGGTPTNTQGGNGGVGLSYSISGSSVYYAGGGGGGVYNGGTPGQGGLGGGGNAPAGNATANTGGGGGGQSNNLTDGGAGGSGIVIIRYAYTALTNTPTPTLGLIAAWSGDGNGNDSVGTLNVSPVGGAGYVSGVVGQAFDAEYTPGTKYFASSSPATLNFPNNDFSIKLYLKKDTAISATHYFFGLTGASTSVALANFNNLDSPAYCGGSSGSSCFGIYKKSLTDGSRQGVAFGSPRNPPNTGPTCITVTYKHSTTSLKYYYDGTLQETKTVNTGLSSGSYNVAIGTDYPVSSPITDGYIDEVQLYNTELTSGIGCTAPTSTPTPSPTVTPTPSNTPTPSPTSPPGANCAGAFPATAVVDNFNRANGTLGANWTGGAGHVVSSNQASWTSGGFYSQIWSPTTFTTNQEAYFTIKSLGGGAPYVILVLKYVDGANYLYAYLDNDYSGLLIYKVVSGVDTLISSPATFYDANDRIGARVIGSTLTVYKNTTVVATVDISGWPSYNQPGKTGFFFMGSMNNLIDDFGGGSCQ